MKNNAFYQQVVQFRCARPFTPFEIKLADGRTFTVDSPGFLAVDRSGACVTFCTPDNHFVNIAVGQIAAVELTNVG